jgi:peptidoglycan/LPS O-acetylase OafA/YrhL
MGFAPKSWNNPRLKGRIPELDGVRGLAILLVLIFHYCDSIVRVPEHTWQSYAMLPLRLTWTGVDLFFVLSGFLIGGILYDAKNSGRYFETFYLRRIHRIFPIYYIWIALFVAGLAIVGTHPTGAVRALFNRDIPVWSYPLFLQNFFMTQRGLGPDWIGVSWSLAVEEQFYMLLPLLMRKLSYRAITRLAVGAMVAAPIFRLLLWLTGSYHYGPYTLLPCRADSLGMGVLIAIASRNKRAWDWLADHRTQLYGIACLLGGGMALLSVRQQYFAVYIMGLTWIGAFYATVLVLALVNPGRIERLVFGNSWLRGLGTVAYAVYLFHQAINSLWHLAIFGRQPAITGWTSAGVTILALGSTLLVAAISWRVLEKPLIRRAHSRYKYDRAAEECGDAGGVRRRVCV